MSQSEIELNAEQLKQIAKLQAERQFWSFTLQGSGGDCGCVHVLDRIHKARWRVDTEGRVQGR
jgi:hypothetical protein